MAMRCHYKVLGLELNATTDDIKRSYRKLALRWHPDKNPDSREQATKEFLLVQQAYEVLVDPQERAWYDKHRESILRGGLGKGDRYEDNSLNLFFYFRASCYKGFGDDPQGFYEIYANAFKTIFEEEVEFLEQTEDMDCAPEFGNSQSSYEEVVKPFYAYWEGYCTSKSYVWVEKYDTRDAPHRMVRRQMEQENKRLRNKARKERNEEVRALVAYVKKRDPRIQEYNKLMQERTLERNKLAEERRMNEKKKKLEVMEQYKESDWSSFSALSTELERLEKAISAEFEDDSDGAENETAEDLVADEVCDDDDDSGENVDPETGDLNALDNLFCIACDKTFKSMNAMENHKKSKKHLTLVASLREEMELHDAELLEEIDLHLNPSEDAKIQTQSKKSKKKKKKNATDEEIPSEANEPDSVEQINITSETQPNSTNEENAKGVDKSQKSSQVSTTKDKSSSSDFTCNVCHNSFPTRNKLFDHIKAEGHALRVEAPKPSKKEKGKKSKPR